MIKAVIFDLDGTLADSLYDLSFAANRAIAKYGFPAREREEFKMFVGNGFDKMLSRAVNHSADADTMQKIKREFLLYYGEHYCDKTITYDGVRELLSALRDNGFKIAVVTNKEESLAKEVVNKLFGDIFDVVCGNIEGLPAKPDPASTLLTMQKLGVHPSECVFLGDSGVDVLTGARSGAVPVGETWGFRDEAELKENGARYIINHPSELLNLIGELNNELQ